MTEAEFSQLRLDLEARHVGDCELCEAGGKFYVSGPRDAEGHYSTGPLSETPSDAVTRFLSTPELWHQRAAHERSTP